MHEKVFDLQSIQEKSARNLIESLEQSKTTTLARFLYSLGILGIGETIASHLAVNFKTLDAILNLKLSDLIEITDNQAKSLKSLFQELEN